MNDLTTSAIGRFGEDAAVEYLEKHGYHIVDRNYRFGHYEIDIIAKKWFFIVFVEVKTRTFFEDSIFGRPLDAVDDEKQRRTRFAANAYLYKSKNHRRPRFDIIEVYLDKTPTISSSLLMKSLNHIKNAF